AQSLSTGKLPHTTPDEKFATIYRSRPLRDGALVIGITAMRRRALWFFQRTAPGEIKRISNPSMQRFLVGERTLRQDGDGFVRCIGMSLELHGKKPANVSRVWFSKIRVNDQGKVDPHHRHETAQLARTAAQP